MQTILEPSKCPVLRDRRGREFSLGMLVSEADLSNPIGWIAVDRPLRDTGGATAMSDRMNDSARPFQRPVAASGMSCHRGSIEPN
jgi:hypothetical protein